ncbi:MAG TPA: cytochrome c maturation protein CcmE [Gaiellaceae bacterium]|nr:cytochrome c maturation protein CcmE [Gaiellaceae bacterium]
MPTRSPARLVVALAVAGVLAVFLLYTAVAGHSTPTLTPSEIHGKSGKLSVVGTVTGRLRGDSHGTSGLQFQLVDPQGHSTKRVDVVYRGSSPPPLFRVGRSVVVSGTYAHGRQQGTRIVTKCPSKYTSSAS